MQEESNATGHSGLSVDVTLKPASIVTGVFSHPSRRPEEQAFPACFSSSDLPVSQEPVLSAYPDRFQFFSLALGLLYFFGQYHEALIPRCRLAGQGCPEPKYWEDRRTPRLVQNSESCICKPVEPLIIWTHSAPYNILKFPRWRRP